MESLEKKEKIINILSTKNYYNNFKLYVSSMLITLRLLVSKGINTYMEKISLNEVRCNETRVIGPLLG